jgi:hypothetical protein
MSLPECMRRHTPRQLKIWLAWLDLQWNRPSRSDWYAMQIAFNIACVRGMFAKSPPSFGLKDFTIEFGRKTAPPLSDEERLVRSKASWLAGAGLVVQGFNAPIDPNNPLLEAARKAREIHGELE